MGRVTLHPDSVVLHSAGWTHLETVGTGSQRLLGIDRFGRISEQDVRVILGEDTDACCFVGAPTAFAALVRSTQVITSQGRENVGTVVQKGTPRDWLFEGAAHGGFREAGDTPSLLWTAASELAVLKMKDAILVCCRRQFDGRVPSWLKIRRSRTTDYCAIARRDFVNAASGNCHEFVAEFSSLVATDDEGKIVWDRKHHIWSLWYVTSMMALKKNPRLSFDSLQHSVSVVCQTGMHSIVIGRGASAYATPYDAQTVVVSWESPHWHLIAGGLLVG